jgi:hypothetical protein
VARQKFLTRKPKHESPSWKKRNEARSVLQEQHARRLAEQATTDEPPASDIQDP